MTLIEGTELRSMSDMVMGFGFYRRRPRKDRPENLSKVADECRANSNYPELNGFTPSRCDAEILIKRDSETTDPPGNSGVTRTSEQFDLCVSA